MRSWLLEGWQVPGIFWRDHRLWGRTISCRYVHGIPLCLSVSKGEALGESEDAGPHHRWPVCARTDTRGSIVCVWGEGLRQNRGGWGSEQEGL